MPSLCVLTNSLFYPHIKGGEQLSTWTLLKQLKERGWTVSVIARAAPRTPIIGVGANAVETMLSSQHVNFVQSGGSFVESEIDGIRVAHHFFSEDDLEVACLKYFTESEKPDYILGIDSTAGATYQSLSWEIAEALKIPCFIILRSHSWSRDIEKFSRRPHIHFAANSSFTAAQFLSAFKKEIPVIYPFIKKEDYLLESFSPAYNEGFVTFINPLRIKGSEVVFRLVEKNPEINFYIIPSAWGWPHTEEIRANLRRFKEFKNVVIPAFRDDIRPLIYATRLLLVPSLWEETFGRVVIEFQMNGVPVIATDSGNLRDTVGRGGVVVPRQASFDDYNSAMTSTLHDAVRYAELSALARDNALQDKFSIQRQVETFIQWTQKKAL